MNKQIEEMANVIDAISAESHCYNISCCDCECYNDSYEAEYRSMVRAKYILEAGYRKTSDVATEIISEIEQAIMAHGTKYAMKRLAELKKKYEVTEE